MNMQFSITELSNLTKKTRPTLYKYISSYEEGKLDEIPYSFIQLFKLLNKPNVTNREVIKFCENTFCETTTNQELNEVLTLIKENSNTLDLGKIKEFILEEIKNGK